jgi:predicted TIM-barrel fold metal-dependent hydrolase
VKRAPGEVVDAQVHVWAAVRPDRPWAPGAESYAGGVANRSSAERPPLSPDELLAEMDAAGVARAVLVPPAFEGDRNDVVLDAARRHPHRFAAMGRLALSPPADPGLLACWLDQPGMLGVRLTFHWGAQREWLRDGTADWFWGAAEDAGVPVAVYPPGALPEIAAVAARHPGLRLIVDHFALPLEARDEDIPGVVDALVGLARLDNVAVKASALPSYTRDPYPFPRLHEPIRRVVEAFGPRRVFWGSEMSRLRCPYREAVALFTEGLAFLDGDDLAEVMGRGISRWLRWEETG